MQFSNSPPTENESSLRDSRLQQSEGGLSSRSENPVDEQPQQYVFTPPIDIFETDEGLVLQADLPGVTVETLELQVQDNKLTLFGRVTPSVSDDAVAVHLEYEVGDFLRSFILSDNVDHDRIRATMNDGVLKIVLPTAPAAQPRFIEVKSD